MNEKHINSGTFKNGHKHSPEVIEKLRLSHIGKKHTPESIQKMKGHKPSRESILKGVASRKGYKPSPETIEKIRQANLGKKSPFKGVPRSEETKQKIREHHRLHPTVRTQEQKDNLRLKHLGKKLPPRSKEWCENISKVKRGAGCNFWKGGITKKNMAIRNSREYRLWQIAVFTRDKNICQMCGCGQWDKVTHKKITMQAHHIKAFSEYPDLRFDVDNGTTLCKSCHFKTDNYGNTKAKKLTTRRCDTLVTGKKP